MSAKRSVFPGRDPAHAHPGHNEPDLMDDLYTGNPGVEQPRPEPEDLAAESSPRGANRKGHAAYAAHEKRADPRQAQPHDAGHGQPQGPGSRDPMDMMPPFEPRQKGHGLGGLFSGRGLDEEAAPAHTDPLSIIPADVLERECRARLCPDCPVQKEAADARLRALAEVDNAKKRMEREHSEQARFAAEGVLSDILPSLDNLELALQHASGNEACKDFVTGVRMTRKLLDEALAGHGLKTVGERGEEFNPALHEAMGMVNDHEVPDGHISSLLARGYQLNGRLLRPAKVMVCRKG